MFENGTYHVFYRHNPAGEDAAGAVDWAHATSTDLVNWTDQPVAVAGTADESVLSGAVVAAIRALLHRRSLLVAVCALLHRRAHITTRHALLHFR